MSAMCSRVCRNEGNVMKSKREKYYTDKNRSICLLPSSTLEECSTDRSNSILLNIKQTGTNITFWTSHRLEWVHQVVIKLKHPIFGFKRMDIEHSSTHYSDFVRNIDFLCQIPKWILKVKNLITWYMKLVFHYLT